MEQREAHKHSYTKLGFVKEFGTNIARANKLVPDPVPKDINRIILTRACDCGISQAFECGNREAMQKLYRKLR